MPASQIFDQKHKLTKFSINLKLFLIYAVRTDKMNSVLSSVSFKAIKSQKFVHPKSEKSTHAGITDFLGFLAKNTNSQNS